MVGLQLGAVAVAGKVRGSQVGLVTYAHSVEGVAVAPFPWVDDGIHAVEAGSTRAAASTSATAWAAPPMSPATSAGARPRRLRRGRRRLRLRHARRRSARSRSISIWACASPCPAAPAKDQLTSRAVLALPVAGSLNLFAGGGLAGVKSGDGEAFGAIGLRFER
ncbi:MAG: hypothetical protein U1F43_18560 [Myxococcota bacterium]